MSEIVMPRLSDSMEEGVILSWLKSVGDEIAVGDEIVEIETDKANMAYEADVAGTLTEILAQEGDTLPIGAPIARIGDGAGEGDGEGSEAAPAGPVGAVPPQPAVAKASSAVGPPTPPPADEEPEVADGAGAGEEAPKDERVKASPLARRLAKEKGIDLSGVAGSGPGGRVVKADVEAAAAATPTPQEGVAEAAAGAPASSSAAEAPETAKGIVTVEELSKLQQVVARRMSESKATAPHFNLQAEIDMTAAVEGRKKLKELAGEGEVVPTFNDMVVKACALALKEFPRANGSYKEGRFELYSRVNVGVAVAARTGFKAAAKEGEVVPSFNDMVVKACAIALREFPKANGGYRDGRIELYSRVNVGVAVAAEQLLVVPTVFDADKKGLRQIATEARELAGRVRDGSITPPELSGGTFTVSNLGMYGIANFSAVINAPQAGILAVGAIAERPVVRDGNITTAQLMGVTLACDHRILYGADGAQFLARIRALLEEPISLAL